MHLAPVTACLLAALVGATAARAQTPQAPVEITVTERQCRALVAHRPADDVTYRPGRDVRGRPVAPADVAGSPTVPELSTITIPLQLSLSDIAVVPPGIDADIPLWTLTVSADGRSYINGQPLHDQTAARLAEICRERFGL